MNKKITRWSLMNILFAILVSIPLWSIVVRTGYVLLNKNAYKSYSGENDQYEIINIDDRNDLKVDDNYIFNNQNNINISSVLLGNSNQGIYFDDFNIIFATNNSYEQYYEDIVFVACYNAANSNTLYCTFKDNNNNDLFSINNLNYTFMFSFTYKSNNLLNNYLFSNTDVIYQEKYLGSKLDNVFDYSIDKFNSENDAHFDFVSNVANIFITEDSYGWRYVEFVNWYFNYFIVISAVYILFLAIIWFIAVSRHLIERSMHLW